MNHAVSSSSASRSSFSRFLLLFAGELISSIGSGLTSFGLGVYIFQKTGSAANMALVTLTGFLPTLLLSLPAGTLADRHDRRLLMMIGDGFSALGGSAANMALVTLTGFLPTLLLSLPAGTLADRHDRRLLMMIGDGFSALGILYILLCMMQGEPALWQICLGVFVSTFFSALLEPAFRATITDLLTPDEYSKAAGLLSLAQSARFLISPVLTGALLAVTDIKVLLVIDVCTFFPTVFAAAAVRNSLSAGGQRAQETRPAFLASMTEGWQTVTKNHGLFLLILVSTLLTCFMGSFQPVLPFLRP